MAAFGVGSIAASAGTYLSLSSETDGLKRRVSSTESLFERVSDLETITSRTCNTVSNVFHVYSVRDLNHPFKINNFLLHRFND